jgi:hypothetical protein
MRREVVEQVVRGARAIRAVADARGGMPGARPHWSKRALIAESQHPAAERRVIAAVLTRYPRPSATMPGPSRRITVEPLRMPRRAPWTPAPPPPVEKPREVPTPVNEPVSAR